MWQTKKISLMLTISFICLAAFNSLAWSADNNSRLYRPVDNWNVDGANGTIYVSGSLTQSPCRLSMTSSYQTVEMGNSETALFSAVGQKGQKIPFQIELQDCIEMQTNLQNVQTGQTAWSETQPAVKIRFLAKSVPFNSGLVEVNGVDGLGLELSESNGVILPVDKQSNPVLLASGQNILTYYVTPVRIAQNLQPGAYSALISFEMLYE